MSRKHFSSLPDDAGTTEDDVSTNELLVEQNNEKMKKNLISANNPIIFVSDVDMSDSCSLNDKLSLCELENDEEILSNCSDVVDNVTNNLPTVKDTVEISLDMTGEKSIATDEESDVADRKSIATDGESDVTDKKSIVMDRKDDIMCSTNNSSQPVTVEELICKKKQESTQEGISTEEFLSMVEK